MRGWLLVGAVLAGAAGAAGWGGLALYRSPGPLRVAVDVVVPRGSLAATGRVLRRSGVVDSAWLLRGFAVVTTWQGPLKAAELSFPAGASVETVLFVLRHGRPVQHRLTIPEGVTAAWVGRLLVRSDALTGVLSLPSEGEVLPETYAYERGASIAGVVQRARAAMDQVAGPAWMQRAAGLPLRGEHELLVLASLVERETHLPAERALVAAVFVNRLRLGMRLQSDAAVLYGASGGEGAMDHGLRQDELGASSAYNTYLEAGLPSGAICNPGSAALLAAAHPARSDALYFVADGSGGHVFARTLDEHERNVARLRALGR